MLVRLTFSMVNSTLTHLRLKLEINIHNDEKLKLKKFTFFLNNNFCDT